MQSQNVEQKEIILGEIIIFLFKRSHVQTKRKYSVYKKIQLLRVSPVYSFFVERRSHMQTIEYFLYKE